MTEFCGLRAKLYSFTTQGGGGGEVKCKGIKKEVIKNSITIEDLKNVLFEGGQQMREMGVIRSLKHDLFSQRVNKVAISATDDKRRVLKNGVNTLALGHRCIRKTGSR